MNTAGPPSRGSAPPPSSPHSSSKIIGAFLRAALGPIQYAAGLITANKVVKGIEELAAEPLESAVKRGIGDVAKLVGLPRAEIEAALPTADFAAAARQIAVTQPR